MTDVNARGKPRPKGGNKTGTPPETGRPYKELDAELFERLCQSMCTHDEIEAMMKTDIDTLHSWCERKWGEPFSAVYKRFSNGGRASLRRTQLRLAQKNAAMAIWCGKQYLGQTDQDKTYNNVVSDNTAKLLTAVDLLQQRDINDSNANELQAT